MLGVPAWRQGWDFNHSLLEGNHHGVGAVVGLQFAQQAGDVGFDSVDLDDKAVCDRLIAHPFAKSTQHVLFLQAQFGRDGT